MSDELKKLRKRSGCTQSVLAASLGVARQVLSNWERRDAVPAEQVPRLAEKLGVAVELLAPLGGGMRRGRPCRARNLPVRRTKNRPTEDVNCGVDRLLAMGPIMRDFVAGLRRQLGAVGWRTFEQCWPRDTRSELMVACWFLHAGAKPAKNSLLNLSFDQLVVAKNGHSYAGDQRQWTLLWTSADGRLTLVVFPQIRIVVVGTGVLYRVDFLLWVKADGVRPFFMVLEIDGESHEYKPSQDHQRAMALRMPEIRCENRVVMERDFFQWLLVQIEMKIQQRRKPAAG